MQLTLRCYQDEKILRLIGLISSLLYTSHIVVNFWRLNGELDCDVINIRLRAVFTNFYAAPTK